VNKPWEIRDAILKEKKVPQKIVSANRSWETLLWGIAGCRGGEEGCARIARLQGFESPGEGRGQRQWGFIHG